MPPKFSQRYSPSRRTVFALAEVSIVAIFVFVAATLTESANTKTVVPQATTPGITQIALATNDIIYDPARQTIYASVPSGAAGNADNVVRINPATGAIGPAVTSGSNPGRLALSADNQFLYVGFGGTNTIRRFDLQSSSTASEFGLGMGSFGTPNRAEEIEVLPGQPQAVAVALRDQGGTHQGVAIYDNGVARPNKVPQSPQNNVIEFAGNAAILFGYNTADSESGLHRLAVDANGITHLSTISNMIKGNADIRFDGGRLFASNGIVFDPQEAAVVGAFQLPGVGNAVVPDAANNRVYFLSAADTDHFVSLWAFDLQTFLPVGKVGLPALTGQPSRLIRCGPNVLAVRTSDNQVFLIQLSAIQPITPAALPSPTMGADAVIKLQLPANDLIFDPGTQKVYASVPGNVAGIGNSIAPIDPNTGNVSTPVFVGSGPNRLAVSDNNQYLYAGLDGAAGVRRFDLQSQAVGPQFSLGFSQSDGQLTALDIEVQPGNASVLAISLKNRAFSSAFNGVAIYDNGVKRSKVISSFVGSQSIEFGSASVLYGLGGFSEFIKASVDGSGVSVIKQTRNVVIGAGDFAFEAGTMYANNGQAVEPETANLVGAFPISGPVVSNVAANRVYYLDWSPGEPAIIFAFDSSTFVPVAFLAIPNIVGTPGSFIRWGSDGLAFRTTGGQIFFFHTSSMHLYPTDTPTLTTRSDGIREFSLLANDIVYNPADNLIYASVPSVAGSIGNSIAAINPTTGLVGQPVFIGSEPYKLAIADTGKVLYATLGGAPRVRKFDLTTKTPGNQFGLGNDSFDGPFYGENIAVAPGNPDMVAVSTYLLPILGGTGVLLTNNGVVLPNSTHGESLAFSGSHLYTYTNDTTEFGLRKLAINSNGLSEINFVTNLVNGFGQRIVTANGRIYGSDGAVADVDSLTLAGKFFRTDPGVWVAPDPANNRVYFLGIHEILSTSLLITAYDTRTFLQVGSLTLNNVRAFDVAPVTFIRYGTDGLAFTTSNGKIFFLSTSMIVPLSPTPVPTPVQVTPEIKQLPLTTRGLVYNSTDGMIYASVPSRTDGFNQLISFGNSIVPINPVTGTMGQPVHIGSEPKKLIITPNNQHIYAALDGEGAVARLDMATKTVGLRFSLGNDGPSRGPRFVEDMQVAPGTVSTLAISRMHKNGTPRHVGVAIYDNGVQRLATTSTEFPNHFDNNNAIEYSSSPSTIYGYSLESTIQNYHKLTVTASGVQVTTTIQNPFNIADFVFDNGSLYATNGQVINPETAAVVGTFSGLSSGNQLVIPESSTDRIYFLDDNLNGNITIRVYKQSTRALIGTMAVPNVRGFVASFIRWGTNGLAFRVTSDVLAISSQVYIIQLPPALTPTPTPTPTPGPLELLLDSSGPAADQVASLDSALFLRDPFPVVNPANLYGASNDRNTRVIVFVRNLQLAQGQTASSVVVNLVDATNQNHDIPAEDVRSVPNTDFVQVVFRLPNNLAVGTVKVNIKAQTRVSNTGTMRIRT